MPAIRRRWTTADVRALTSLEREAVGVAFTSPADLELEPGTITQPDVFVVPADTRPSGDLLEWPDVKSLLLAVEVLSPSSLRTDRIVKRDFYRHAGVPDYWIVDLDAHVVERWSPYGETPEIHGDRVVWTPRGANPLVVDLPALFARIETKASVFRIGDRRNDA